MKLTSPAFSNNEPIPAKYTCDGEDVSPALMIDDVPENTQSLVLIVDDPDAPSGTWVHWTIWNIDPLTAEISEGQAPDGSIEGTTSYGKPGWGGPCPPSGTHRYHFKLYALDNRLNLVPAANVADLEQAIADHIIDEDILIGTYKRQ